MSMFEYLAAIATYILMMGYTVVTFARHLAEDTTRNNDWSIGLAFFASLFWPLVWFWIMVFDEGLVHWFHTDDPRWSATERKKRGEPE